MRGKFFTLTSLAAASVVTILAVPSAADAQNRMRFVAMDQNNDGQISVVGGAGEYFGQNDECILTTIPIGPSNVYPRGVAIDKKGKVWASTWSDGKVYRYNPNEPVALEATLTVGGNPYSLATGGDYLFVSNQTNGGTRRVQLGEDGMADGVGADLHAGGAQCPHLGAAHHQVVRRSHLGPRGDRIDTGDPGLGRQVLDALDEPAQRGAAAGVVAQCVLAQVFAAPVDEAAQVQRRQPAEAHGLDQRVVPHAAAVQETGGDEEAARQAVLLQQRQRDVVVVGVAVVEAQRGGAGRQAAVMQLPDRRVQRQHVEPGLGPAQQLVEAGGIDLVGKQRVRLAQHAVEDQHRQARARTGR